MNYSMDFIESRSKKLTEAIENAHSIFVFDPEITKYIDELEDLQAHCQHEYLDGKCIHCGKEFDK